MNNKFESGSTMTPLSKEDEFETEDIADFYDIRFKINRPFYEKEKYIAERLADRISNNFYMSTEYTEEELQAHISDYEKENNITLSDEQKEGVKILLLNQLAILTGGPGTGKTSVLKCILYCIEKHEHFKEQKKEYKIACMAPTGKAAKRMEEATGYKALTILKAINYNPFSRQVYGLPAKYIFIDESSMIDIENMELLLRALSISGGLRLYFIGDPEQLPSVGKGAVFRDMINSRKIPCCNLVKTFRQKEGSVLLDNIGIIKKGLNYPLAEGSDFILNEDINSFLKPYYKEIAERGYQNVCVLTPNRKVGNYCSENLNKIIQNKINQRNGFEATIKRDGREIHLSFRYGDPVIQLVNKQVANGEVGVVVFADEHKCVVEFSDKTQITYTKKNINELDLAYAISIHKSQGSEYPVVFVLCDKSRLLDRNMIYTAVTRAKKKCYLIGDMTYIQACCKKENTNSRVTALGYLLEEFSVMHNILQDVYSE